MGFEPTNGGFADLSLGPLGYRAEEISITKAAMGAARRSALLGESQKTGAELKRVDESF